MYLTILSAITASFIIFSLTQGCFNQMSLDNLKGCPILIFANIWYADIVQISPPYLAFTTQALRYQVSEVKPIAILTDITLLCLYWSANIILHPYLSIRLRINKENYKENFLIR